jgi:hypothetical protein
MFSCSLKSLKLLCTHYIRSPQVREHRFCSSLLVTHKERNLLMHQGTWLTARFSPNISCWRLWGCAGVLCTDCENVIGTYYVVPCFHGQREVSHYKHAELSVVCCVLQTVSINMSGADWLYISALDWESSDRLISAVRKQNRKIKSETFVSRQGIRTSNLTCMVHKTARSLIRAVSDSTVIYFRSEYQVCRKRAFNMIFFCLHYSTAYLEQYVELCVKCISVITKLQ